MEEEGALEKSIIDLLRLFNVDVKEVEESDEERKAIHLGDFSSLINKAEERLSGLRTQENEILKKTNMTRKEMEEYAENPDNFTKEQWEALERFKEQMAKFRQETDALLNKAVPRAEGEVVRKKPKRRPVPKKGWIPL